MSDQPKFQYAMGQLTNAVQGIAGSQKRLQERLADAYVFNIMQLKAEDVTPEIWARIEKLERAVMNSAEETGAANDATSRMTDEVAKKWLEEIVSIYGLVAAKAARASGEKVSERYG